MSFYLQNGFHKSDSLPCTWGSKKDIGGGATLPPNDPLHSCTLAWVQGRVEELVLLEGTGDMVMCIRTPGMGPELQQGRHWARKTRKEA